MEESNFNLWKNYFDIERKVKFENGNTFQVYMAGTNGPNIVLLHGAGHTSLSWALATSYLKQHCHIFAIDFRGHGGSYTIDDTDLSSETIVLDILNILQEILPLNASSMVLVGHSMGGAIAVRVAEKLTQNYEYNINILGLIVIDVVEGTALSSLKHMNDILAKRPSSFLTIKDAIEWSMVSGTTKNTISAEISVPSQLVKVSGDNKYTWRTDLKSSEKYWKGWFQGLSDLFLDVRVPKILLLAGTDRLDTSLTRGQMQGKFQLSIIYGSGHIIQEDAPKKTADEILNFCSRFISIPLMISEKNLLALKLEKARAMIPQ